MPKKNGRQTALMEGTDDKVGYWLTPPEVMEPIRKEFHIDFDPCPFPRPAGWNGLIEDWGRSNYVNPPFGGTKSKSTSFAAWARKAVAEHAKGKTVVLILPVDRWMNTLLEAGAEVRFLGFTDWVSPDGKRKKSSRANALFILKGDPSGGAKGGGFPS